MFLAVIEYTIRLNALAHIVKLLTLITAVLTCESNSHYTSNKEICEHIKSGTITVTVTYDTNIIA